MSPRSLLAPLLCLTLTSAGCAIRGNSRGAAYTVDVAMAGVGAAALAKADATECDQGWDGLDCELGSGLLGGAGLALVAAGVIGLVVNYAINIGVESEPAPAVQPIAIQTTDAPPSLAPSFCSRLIDAWIAEPDPVRKTERYEAMPGSCQQMLTPRGSESR